MLLHHYSYMDNINQDFPTLSNLALLSFLLKKFNGRLLEKEIYLSKRVYAKIDMFFISRISRFRVTLPTFNCAS